MEEFGETEHPVADPDEAGIEALPIVFRRFEVYVPGPGESVAENPWGLDVPHAVLRTPPLRIDNKYFSGSRYEVSKLPGAGKYEVLVMYNFLTDELLEKLERGQAAAQAAMLEEMDPYLEDDDV